MHKLSTSFVLGYHGCSGRVARELLAGGAFHKSDNDYDWLGSGVYFWQSNPRRALQFAAEKRSRERARWKPAVVGAVIDLGLCLDLTTQAGIDQVKAAHQALLATLQVANKNPPANSGGTDKLLRRLDCAVINTLHELRASGGVSPASSVVGIFHEGAAAYDGSGFFEKTHIQICVRDPGCIHGVFRVPESDLTT